MRAYVIRIVGAAGHAPAPPDAGPWYVQSFDPDFKEGQGEVVTTPDPHKALSFRRSSEGWALWRQQSTVKPLREDGQPNRPLTAFTVSVEPLKEEEANE